MRHACAIEEKKSSFICYGMSMKCNMVFKHLWISTYVMGLEEAVQSNIEAAAEKISNYIGEALWV